MYAGFPEKVLTLEKQMDDSMDMQRAYVDQVLKESGVETAQMTLEEAQEAVAVDSNPSGEGGPVNMAEQDGVDAEEPQSVLASTAPPPSEIPLPSPLVAAPEARTTAYQAQASSNGRCTSGDQDSAQGKQ